VPLISVAVPVPFLDLLVYRVPPDVEVPCRGARVLVPLGPRIVTGCVVGAAEAPEDEQAALRDVQDVLDAAPFLPGPIVDLALWVADYYMAGPGEAIAAAMPPLAWVQSERVVRITEAGLARLADGGEAGARETVLELLRDRRRIYARNLPALASARAGTAARPVRGVQAAVASLASEGHVAIETPLEGQASAFRTRRMASLTLEGFEAASNASATQARLGAAARRAIELLRHAPEGRSVPDLRDEGIGADTIGRLRARGLVSIRRERIDRDPFEAAVGAVGSTARIELTPTLEQRTAIDRLAAHARAGAFQTVVLRGVTGSGKTEVYLRLARTVLESGRAVLMMVPEIALAPAVAAAFRAAFGESVAIQHSGLSDGERHDQWQRIRAGAVKIVIGTRSAVFAPLDSPGLIIVDEEHDASYKQDETPRYNGRDVAIVRGKREGALVVLGSATPSLESYFNAQSGRYALVTLDRRVLDRPLANVRIVNMREEFAERGPELVLSGALQEAIARRLERREQAVVLLNRRGFATAVFCRQCAGTVECPNCSVTLTVHREARRARCHYCNYSTPVPVTCPLCAGPYLEQIGFGTERIQEEIRAAFPEARVARLDRDSVRKRGALPDLLSRFARRDLDILVGTQMIAKGHDFPAVTLVGVISADVGLGVADFRAAERTFQLLTQVAGRAGRGDIPGEAIVQTLYPEHYSIRLACRQDFPAFFDDEMRYRRAMRYPPAVALINVVVRGRTFSQAMEAASDLCGTLRAIEAFRVLGPAPAPLGRLRGEHRVQFFLKGAARAAMRKALAQALDAHPDLRRRVSVDVDPLSML
jgi:primosomal protein N' (replication factor Y)